jgi:hypothetical protein
MFFLAGKDWRQYLQSQFPELWHQRKKFFRYFPGERMPRLERSAHNPAGIYLNTAGGGSCSSKEKDCPVESLFWLAVGLFRLESFSDMYFYLAKSFSLVPVVGVEPT